MSETAVRVFSGERRASAGVKDPADKDTLDNEGVAKSEDAWQALLDAVTESLDSKGADAE
ncbi:MULTISPECIES: hypothetical protein [unclassified Streptomyces]|uniref:hypothetical protein n=1 Tax=unclassified Streptomyces TaxID=2593676 RepID=UPI00117DF525|nr:hypothetical protein [Streptomyces sp. 13-12-16]